MFQTDVNAFNHMLNGCIRYYKDCWPKSRPGNRPKTVRTTNKSLPQNLPDAPPDFPEIAHTPPRSFSSLHTGTRRNSGLRTAEQILTALWVLYELFPVFSGSLQGCLLDGLDLLFGQFSIYFPDGFSVENPYNSC